MTMDVTQSILSDITIFQKYVKWIPELGRRETWNELCERNMVMHIRKYPQLKDEIKQVYKKFVFTKKVLPSMRSMQFAGRPIELSNNRLFNCAYLPIEHIDSFKEVMFLLLGGSGVGYSVQSRHVEKLPVVMGPKDKSRRFLVGDSIEGWADAVKIIVESYFLGKSNPEFDYRDIRPKGARLVTSGGKAPGPDPLRICIEQIRSKLNNAIGRKLKPIEAHDIMCHIADAVLTGGIRRAAMISLFSRDDMDMMTCKAGQWYELNPQRGRANNSVVLHREEVTKEEFFDIWERIQFSGAGEPGIFWTNDFDLGTNPCCFTGDTQIAVADGRNQCTIEQLANESDGKITFPVYSARYARDHWKTEVKSAVAFCTGTKPVVLITLSNGDQIKCTDDHLIAKPDGSYIMARDSLGLEIESFFTVKNKYRTINSFSNAYSRQYRLLWEYYNGLKPEGLEIDHIENSGDDSLSNLQLIDRDTHLQKTSKERMGENNSIFRLKNKDKFIQNLSCAMSMSGNPRFGGLFDEDLIEIGKKCLELGLKLSNTNCRSIDVRFPLTFSKNRFGGSFKNFRNIVLGNSEYNAPILPEKVEYEKVDYEHLTQKVYVSSIEDFGVEKVYDLTVEDNHNFYIITESFDENSIESRGVLVHNCEISLKPYQFCNLTEVNVSDIVDQDDLNNRAKSAAFIGTLQAGYTSFHYLRSEWQEQTETEALIGVGQTGIASGTILELNLDEAAKIVLDENERVAGIIGINIAARTTTVKPSGSTSLVLGSSSGIHAWHNEYYIRRMRVGKNEALYAYMKENFPDLIEDCYFKPHIEAVMSFPQKAPEGAIYRTESFMHLLERVKKFNIEWVAAGHRTGDNKHNVSCTISLKVGEWHKAGSWMWKNKNLYTGISVLPYDGGSYKQAPFEDCTKEKFDEMVSHLHAIDLTKVKEIDDNTTLTDQAACSGGLCEVSL